MPKDLRSYLDDVKDVRVDVHREVDPLANVGALCDQSEWPIVFHALRGFPGWRLADRLVSRRELQARILGCAPDRVVHTLAEAFQRIGAGTLTTVSKAPVQDVVRTGGEVDLTALPHAIHSEADAGRYIGGGICITRDPESRIRNCAFLRHQIKGPRRTGFLVLPRHTWRHQQKYERAGEAMPMAVVLGVHPAYEIAACYTGKVEQDELELAAVLVDEPVELVRCATIDLEVPAHAEIVIEGRVPPGVREDEGPFGEVTNYTAGQGRNPVFEVTAITTRRDPIYRHIQATRFTDHQVLGALPVEAGMLNRIRETAGGIDVHEVACPAWCSRYTVIVQLTPRFDGEARAALLAALSSPYLYPKVAIAVDDDVDIHDARDVMWALATRVNPETDVHVIPGMRAHGLDLASPELLPPGSPAWQRVGGKMLIDATKPATWRASERELFARARPRGWGVRLEDFLRG
ncbi:MAG TPA: UbiD family decarboxylase [Candidatus Tectomicrobia bacterium]|nr:UbiD family decarboxylase [Candidatus Tectomicrobia bacterium]